MQKTTSIKDKRITIYAVVSRRSNRGYERKVKERLHKTQAIWAYVRQLSDSEKFASKAAGVEQTMLFRINHNPRISIGQYIEFKGEAYRIVSVDGYEQYVRDLTLKAIGCTRPDAEETDCDEQQSTE